VLAGVLAPPAIFALLLALVGAIALRELVALRRAGVPAALEGALLVIGLAALFWLRTWWDGDLARPGVVPPPLVAILATWAADVGAYLIGSVAGSHKLAPTLSPGKTREGTIGGFVAGGLTVVALGAIGEGLPNGAALALTIGPAALAGDLLESWVKRRAGVKDSGTLLPGHGGMLDRIDSLIATAPLVAAFLAGPLLRAP